MTIKSDSPPEELVALPDAFSPLIVESATKLAA